MNEETKDGTVENAGGKAKELLVYETPLLEELGPIRTMVQGCFISGSDGGGPFSGCLCHGVI